MSELVISGLMGAISRLYLLTPGTFSVVDSLVIGFAGGVFGGVVAQAISPGASDLLMVGAGVVGQIAYDNFLFDM